MKRQTLLGNTEATAIFSHIDIMISSLIKRLRDVQPLIQRCKERKDGSRILARSRNPVLHSVPHTALRGPLTSRFKVSWRVVADSRQGKPEGELADTHSLCLCFLVWFQAV